MRAHQIVDGKVVNTIEVASYSVLADLVDAALGGKVGDTWDGAKFITPAPTPDEIAAASAAATRAAQEAETAAAVAVAQADATIQFLLTHTLAECTQYAVDNFPSLTAAEKTKLGKLFMVVAVFAKKFLR